MTNENNSNEEEIERTLKFIKKELYKTNELKKLLWEFMHENPVITLNPVNDDEKTSN